MMVTHKQVVVFGSHRLKSEHILVHDWHNFEAWVPLHEKELLLFLTEDQLAIHAGQGAAHGDYLWPDVRLTFKEFQVDDSQAISTAERDNLVFRESLLQKVDFLFFIHLLVEEAVQVAIVNQMDSFDVNFWVRKNGSSFASISWSHLQICVNMLLRLIK